MNVTRAWYHIGITRLLQSDWVCQHSSRGNEILLRVCRPSLFLLLIPISLSLCISFVPCKAYSLVPLMFLFTSMLHVGVSYTHTPKCCMPLRATQCSLARPMKSSLLRPYACTISYLQSLQAWKYVSLQACCEDIIVCLHFYNLHRQQLPYALRDRIIIKGIS